MLTGASYYSLYFANWVFSQHSFSVNALLYYINDGNTFFSGPDQIYYSPAVPDQIGKMLIINHLRYFTLMRQVCIKTQIWQNLFLVPTIWIHITEIRGAIKYKDANFIRWQSGLISLNRFAACAYLCHLSLSLIQINVLLGILEFVLDHQVRQANWFHLMVSMQ